MRYSTLLVDLDGVLRQWPDDYFTLEKAHGLPPGAIGKTAFEPSLLEQAITGRLSDHAWRVEVARRLASTYPLSRAKEAVAAWSTVPGVVQEEVLLLVRHARRHCRVGLVTNATDRLNRDLASLGLVEHLDFVVNSCEVGFAKPSPEIFLRALSIAGDRPQSALYIDDSQANVSAAVALGIKSHRFTSVSALDAFMQAVGKGPNAA